MSAEEHEQAAAGTDAESDAYEKFKDKTYLILEATKGSCKAGQLREKMRQGELANMEAHGPLMRACTCTHCTKMKAELEQTNLEFEAALNSRS